MTEALITRFNTLIDTTFDKFEAAIKPSPRNRIEVVELAAAGIISALVTRNLARKPQAIVAMRPGEAAHLQIEDYYIEHQGEVKVEHVRHNLSGQSTLGMGTELSLGVDVIAEEAINELEEMMSTAIVHPNPRARL